MSRALYIATILLLHITGTRTQSISPSDGYVDDLRQGVAYTLLPVARGDTLVVPYDSWYGSWAEPMAIRIDASPFEEFLVTLSISGNVNDWGGPISASFADDAMWWAEEGRYIDPRATQRVSMDSTGKATLSLGMTITIPLESGAPLFEVLVNCAVVNPSTGDTIFASVICGAAPNGHPGYFPTEMKVTNLRRGRTYTIHPGPDTMVITPVDDGAETGGMEPFRIVGNAGSQVILSFVLPRAFPSEDELGSLPCSFDTNSVYIEELDQWLDPNPGAYTRIGPGGVSSLRMGVTLDIPADAHPGWYAGQIILSVAYTGNRLPGSIPSHPSESELLILVEVLGDELPEVFSLSQNYPNPFNGTTTIEYALPEASHVALEIYDPLGRKVRTLVDDARDAGIHREVLEARDLPSGLYVYRLTAGVFRDMRKLLLIR